MVEAVVALAVEKLGGLLIEEFGYAVRRTHVKSEVEWVERELIRIKCFLKDADAKQKGDDRVKNWVKDIRDVAYQVEDAIDTFIMIKSTCPRRRAGFIKRCVCCFSFLLSELLLQHKLGKDIQRIKVKISDISASRITYGIENIGGGGGEGSSCVSEKLRERRRSSPRMDDHDVIGFDEDINMLVARLLDQETPRRSIISIVGMGGLGKTTLAKKVYNCTSVNRRFDFCAWVYVSQDYRAGELLHEIGEKILRIEKGGLAMMNRQYLEERVSTVLRKKRYLIVLDDIWETEVWDDLKTLFPDDMNASRVLFTTRIRDVAIHADPRSATHELQFLNQAQSWELFLKKAFPMEGDSVTCPPELEKLGTQIVAKCGGLPLAIVIMGGLLSRKEKIPSVWLRVLQSISWQLNNDRTQLMEILALSYNDLPYYLKPCFLYFGLFLEDLEIPVGKLVLLWIAEGFVQQRGKESLEDVAQDFLEELVDRSMIQVAEKRYDGKIKMCRIHDLLRDLAMSEAEECKFLEILDSTNIGTSVTTRARRISVHSSLEEYMKLRHPNPHFRSMLCFSRFEGSLRRDQWKSLFGSLKLLRVLDLERVNIRVLPKEIRELVHLRYMGLRGTGLQRLPSSIYNFCNLQTLDIRDTKVSRLPIQLWKMPGLRHLYLEKASIAGHPPLHVSAMHLQTLSTVSIYGNNWISDLLGKLTNLRKLGVHGYFASQTEALSRCLVKLSNLQNLLLRGTEPILEPTIKLLLNQPNIHKLHLCGPIRKLPDPQEIQPNLIKIILEESLLVQDIFVTLEKLPNLRILKLLANSFFGKEITCSASGFPKLHRLVLSDLDNLEEWRVDDGAMPSLQFLTIHGCDQLKKIPEGFQYLTALRELILLNMPDEFEARINGDDWYKMQHIPSIVVRQS